MGMWKCLETSLQGKWEFGQRLNGAQKALANNLNDFLIQLEKKLIEEYSLIMLQEEEFWALKSRLNWAAFGDRNTSFFHVSTVVRRHKNRTRCIKDAMGEWIFDKEEIKILIRNSFLKLFQQSYRIPLGPREWHNFLVHSYLKKTRNILMRSYLKRLKMVCGP